MKFHSVYVLAMTNEIYSMYKVENFSEDSPDAHETQNLY